MPKSKNNINSNLIKLSEFIFIVIILFLTSVNLSKYSNNNKVLGLSTEKTSNFDEKIIYLENVVNDNPLYFDAYIELVRLNIENNNFENAKKYFEALRTINPNSQTIRILEKELSNLN